MIRSATQVRLDIKSPGPEHVVAAADPVSIQPDRGQRIEPVTYELNMPLVEQPIRNLKGALEEGAFLCAPLDLVVVLAEERIGNLAGSQEIRVGAARNHCTNRIGPPFLAQRPRVATQIERNGAGIL